MLSRMINHDTHDAPLAPGHFITIEHVLCNLTLAATAGASPSGVLPALKRFVRLTQCDPRITPANRASLDQQIDQIRRKWLSHGFASHRAFQNWASLVRRAVQSYTEENRTQQSQEWRNLSQDAFKMAAVEKYRAAGVSTIMRLALNDNISPENVNSVWLARKAVELKGRAKNGLFRAVTHWNALAKSGLPVSHLDKPASPRTYLRAYPAELPKSLNLQIEGLISELRNRNNLSVVSDPVAMLLNNLPENIRFGISAETKDFKNEGLSDSYISNIQYNLYRSAGVLLRAGSPASSLTSIDKLLTKEAGALLAAEICSRRRIRNAASAHTAIVMLQVVARHLKLTEAAKSLEAVRLSPYVKTPSVDEMGESRKVLLRQFDERAAVFKWLVSPDLLEARGQISWKQGDARAAIAYYECAVISDILQTCPVRIKNITEARIFGTKPNIIFSEHCKNNKTARLRWCREEVKNRTEIQAELLPKAVRRLIALTTGEVRNVVLTMYGTPKSELLFPGRTRAGKPGIRRHLGELYQRQCQRLGITVTPHLARSLTVKIIRDYKPELKSIETVLLGDSERVIQKFYAEKRIDKAVKEYQGLVISVREQTRSRKRGGLKK